MNIILKLGAGALIACTTVAAAGCANSGASTHKAGAAPAKAQAAYSAMPIPSPRQNAEDKMPRVNVEEARKLVAEGKAIIIDVRGADPYRKSHIKGALDIPMNKLEAGDFKDLPKDKLIIAYCS